MISYQLVILLLVIVICVSTFLVGKHLLKISDLKFWHVLCALCGAGIVAYLAYFIQILALFGVVGILLFYILQAALTAAAFHFILRGLNKSIDLGKSLSLLFVALLITGILAFIVIIPFLNYK